MSWEGSENGFLRMWFWDEVWLLDLFGSVFKRFTTKRVKKAGLSTGKSWLGTQLQLRVSWSLRDDDLSKDSFLVGVRYGVRRRNGNLGPSSFCVQQHFPTMDTVVSQQHLMFPTPGAQMCHTWCFSNDFLCVISWQCSLHGFRFYLLCSFLYL